MNDDAHKQPWGRAVGMLTACIVTLIGVLRGIEPEIILQRASVAAMIMGFLTVIVIYALNVLAETT